MSIAHEVRTIPTGARATYVLTDLVAKAVAFVGRRYEETRTRAILSRLSERDLDDIGLTRADVETIKIYR